MIRILRTLAAAMVFAAFTPVIHSAPADPTPPETGAGPSVVSTEPANGEKAVDPGTKVLKVTFSEPMQAEHYSLTEIQPRRLPQWGAPVTLSEDGRTFSVPITLRPNQRYGIWINAPGHAKFRSVGDAPAQSYQLFFNTAAAAAGGAAPSARVGPTAGEPAAAAPPANGFRILAPADGSEVRERVRVVIPASAVPQNGSVTLFIDGRFILGVAPTRYDETLEYTWNTKDPLPGKETAEKRVPKDGSHIIRAHVIDPAGQIVQVAESTVNLRNLLSEPEVASDGVLLRYRFQPGLDLYYRNRFTADVLAPGSQKRLHEGEIRSGILFEDWSDEGSFVLVGKFGKSDINRFKLTGENLAIRWGMPRAVRVEMEPHGVLRLMGQRNRLLPEVLSQFLVLPPGRVKVGATWESGIIVPEVLKDRSALVQAKHTFEGLEWHGGQETARIRTIYTASVKDPDPSKWSVLATGAVSYPKGSTIDVKGERTTLLAYRIGRVMRMIDQKDVVITLTQPVSSMGGGGMGLGMPAPGMPPMDPGMMDPTGGAGPPPGMGGMFGVPGMPGGMPGMGGMPPGMGGAPGARQRAVYKVERAREVIDYAPADDAGE